MKDTDRGQSEHEVPTEMEGAPPGKKAQHFWPTVRRMATLFNQHCVAMMAVITFIIISVILNVLAPQFLGRATDVVFAGMLQRDLDANTTAEHIIAQLRSQGEHTTADVMSTMDIIPGAGIDFQHLGILIVTVLVMYTIASALQWGQGFILNKVSVQITQNLRNRVEKKIHHLPLSYFDTRQRGDVMSRLTNDVDNIQTTLQQTFSSLLESSMRILGILIMMLILSWQLALVALVALPLSAVAAGFIGVRSQKYFAHQWEATGTLNAQIEEGFSGHRIVTLFGQKEFMSSQFDECNEKLYEASFKAHFFSGMIMPVMQFISWLSYVGIAVIGGLKVISGQMSLGAATAFIQYSREFTQPLSQVAGMASQLQSGIASAERVFELLDADVEKPDISDTEVTSPAKGLVSFENVCFGYTSERPIIHNLSFEAKPGHTVAIVGPTGAGKTTLVNLLMRFYELDSGRISLDGTNIATMPRHQLRSTIGMVLQDAWLFKGTIRENIRYGRLEAADEDVEAAAVATSVDRFVRSLPNGYDTVLEDDGSNISAGERQLITIARAFLAAPALLILDEATSSVDTRTEIAVQKAMSALRNGRTSFVIAHRLSTIRDADTILVMDQGRIVEQGNHTSLLKARGSYWNLYRSQFTQGVI